MDVGRGTGGAIFQGNAETARSSTEGEEDEGRSVRSPAPPGKLSDGAGPAERGVHALGSRLHRYTKAK